MQQQPTPDARTAHVRRLVEGLRPRLIDLSGRNRSVSFRHTDSSRREMRIVAPALDLIWERLYEGRKLAVLSLPQPSSGPRTSPTDWAKANGIPVNWDGDAQTLNSGSLQTLYLPTEFERRAYHLSSTSRLSLTERGVTALFGIFGFLEWYENDEAQAPLLSPLLTMPLRIERERHGTSWRYAVGWSGEDPVPNIALVERMEGRLALPGFAAWDHPTEWLGQVQANLPATPRPWRVHRWLTVGLLDFTRLPMWADLDPARWTDGLPVTGLLADVLGGLDRDPAPDLRVEDVDGAPIRELVPYTLLDADASQVRVIAEAMRGRSIVVQGPPGTGKSQTIANLIGLALDQGKTVLFVSEKQAALDVVLKRLEEVGLDSFCLPLHSARADKKEVIAQLRDRLAERMAARDRPAPTVPLALHDLERDRSILNKLPAMLHRPVVVTGPTLHQLLGQLLMARKALSPLPFHPTAARLGEAWRWTPTEIGLIADKLRSLEHAWHESVGNYGSCAKHPWHSLVAETDESPGNQAVLVAAVRNVHEAAVRAAKSEAAGVAACLPLAGISKQTRIRIAEQFDVVPFPGARPPTQWLQSLATWTGRQDLQTLNGILQEAALEFQIVRHALTHGAAVPRHDAISAEAREVERLGVGAQSLEQLAAVVVELRAIADRWDNINLTRTLPAPPMHGDEAPIADVDPAAASTHAKALESTSWWRGFMVQWWRARLFVRRQSGNVADSLRARAAGVKTLRDRLARHGFRGDLALADLARMSDGVRRGHAILSEARPICQGLVDTDDAEFALKSLQQAHAAIGFATSLDALDLPASLLAWLFEKAPGDRIDALRIALAAEAAAQKELSEVLAQLRPLVGDAVACDLALMSNDALAGRLGAAIDAESKLAAFTRFLRLQSEAAASGVGTIVKAFEAAGEPPRQLAEVFDRLYLEHAVADVIGKEPELQQFHGREHEIVRQRFATNDDGMRKRAARHVVRRLLERPIAPGNRQGSAAELTDAALVRRVGTQTRPRIAVRELFERAAGAIQDVCPCLLMSPLTVSQFIKPGTMTFDMVVMDEASQLRPEDALGALMRARQAVIVGDNKQMPPSSFFISSIGRSDDEADSVDDDLVEESILDHAKTRLHPFTGRGGDAPMLLWHYRSRHPSLVAFSNREFYDDKLQLFPPDAGSESDLGLTVERVEGGVYGSSLNPVEAKAVAAAAIDEMRRHPDRSIGVVALNIQQKELIEAEVDMLAMVHDEVREYLEEWRTGLSPFFVKNLENVQGDERDTMLISTVFGRDATGKFAQNFGALSGRSGPRRLNVLFTRAVRRMRVLTSMDPSWIVAPSEGARVLKGFLEYGGTGRLRDEHVAGNATNYGPDSPFEQAVLDALRAKGIPVVPQVGVGHYRIDIAVRHSEDRDRYILGIECDGATYHSSKCARDRDRLRQQVLEQLGWTIARVWSLDWWREPEAEVARLLSIIDDASERARAQLVSKPVSPAGGAPEVPQRDGGPPIRGSVTAVAAPQAGTSGVVAPSRTIPTSPARPTGPATRAAPAFADGKHEPRGIAATPAQGTVYTPVQVAELRRDEDLRAQLIAFRETIMAKNPEVPREGGVLRKSMLEAFVRTKPTTMDEFRSRVPLSLRQDTDRRHVQYLSEILDMVGQRAASGRLGPVQKLVDNFDD